MTNVKEKLQELGFEETIILENPSYDTAITGISSNGNLIYDYELMVNYLIEHDNMSYEDAVEFIDYNTIRAIDYMGEFKPIVMMNIED
jgi:hypothetical protein